MSNLVNELKSDHKELVSVLTQIKAKGIVSQEAVALLMKAKGALLAHLKKEDTFLYPALNNAAANDKNLKSTLDIFAKDMDKITQSVQAFFNKYEKGGEGLEFAKDIGNLISVLGSRIQREENALYPEYDKIQSKKSA
jgi:iron-sulfur cluster repair protein YtfE (RIC family)